MRWLHISDLHYDPDRNGLAANDMREALPGYLKENIKDVDNLFITGDYRHAGNQRNDNQEEIAERVAQYIWKIANSVGITDAGRIHAIPGNHDLTRYESGRKLKQLQKNYDTNIGKIGTRDLPLSDLLSHFSFYNLVSKCLYGDDADAAVWKDENLLPLHTCRCCGDYNLVYLNTAVTCNRQDERGQLVIGIEPLDLALREAAKNGKPIIILAHHALDSFTKHEREAMEGRFRKYPVKLYLCGDAHESWYHRINDVHEITMGCINYENGTEAVISIGEIGLNGQLKKFNAHRWINSRMNGRWEPYQILDDYVMQSAPVLPAKVVTSAKPSPPTQFFIGREEIIGSIKKTLEEDQKIVLVNGIGGIGKTQICRKLYDECALKGWQGVEQIGWLTFREDLISTFASQFAHIAFKDMSSAEYMERAERYINDAGRGLLLFIDNVNDISPDDVLRLSKLDCRVVMTSRLSEMEYIKPIDVNTLSEEDCRKLYRSHSKDNTAPDAVLNEIIELAKRHTLAIELLAKTQDSGGLTAEELLAELKEKGFQLPDVNEFIRYRHMTDEEKSMEINDRLIEHMAIVFQIADVGGESLRVLRMFSLLAADKLPIKIVKEWFDLPDINEINDLHRRGWVLKEGTEVSMHPVIAAVVRNKCPVGFDESKGLVPRLANTLDIGYTEVFTTKLPFLSHALSVVHIFSQYESEEIAHAQHNVAYVYDSQGDYLKALEWYRKALVIREKVLGKEHPDTAASYNNIALVYSRQGDYLKALEWYQKALVICEKVLGKEYPDTAVTYNNIAFVYDSQGDYPKALEWYQKALVIREKVLGKEHPSTATTYNNIALVYSRQGDYPKSLEWYQKALVINEKVLGKEHPDTATIYNNIAWVYNKQDDYSKALEWYQKALVICEKVLGKEHPDTAATYNNIAVVYDSQGDYLNALELYQKVLAICEKVLGKEHPYTATTYNNIAWVYCNQGDYPNALECLQKTLAIREKVFGKEHKFTKDIEESISFVLSKI